MCSASIGFQIGQPLQGTVAVATDKDGGVGVHLADGGHQIGIPGVPIVDATAIKGFEFVLVPLIENLIGIRLAHQIITDHHRVAAVAFGGVAPHLHPGGLGFGILPDGFDQVFAGEPVIVPVEGEIVAPGAGAEGDHHEQVGVGRHGDHLVQIGLDLRIQLVGRPLGEQAGVGEIDIIGPEIGQPVEILLGIGRADIAAAEEFVAVITGYDDPLPGVGPAQLGAVGPQRPFIEGGGQIGGGGGDAQGRCGLGSDCARRLARGRCSVPHPAGEDRCVQGNCRR